MIYRINTFRDEDQTRKIESLNNKCSARGNMDGFGNIWDSSNRVPKNSNKNPKDPWHGSIMAKYFFGTTSFYLGLLEHDNGGFVWLYKMIKNRICSL